MWEQYIRDLVVFGTNAIELIPPVSDDDEDSPHFPMAPMKMMIEMSRLAKEYGIECWVWYPAMEKDYSDQATVDKALKDWGDVLKQLPRVDAVFVPGGDPGHTAPKDLFALLKKQTVELQKLHPGAKMWMSPQGFNASWMDEFYELMQKEPDWLEGIVFGPQQSESLDDLRAKIPKRFKLRFYPDITHCLRAQYPVPDWDFAYSVTLNREPINPRPVDQSLIFKRLQPLAETGFITYSEGCNDDVNKFVWSGLGSGCGCYGHTQGLWQIFYRNSSGRIFCPGTAEFGTKLAGILIPESTGGNHAAAVSGAGEIRDAPNAAELAFPAGAVPGLL
jgi:hypothetical protein